MTRANGDVVYHKFEGATQLRLRVEGTWLGKDNYTLPHGSVTSTLAKLITKATTAKDATVDSDNDTEHINDTHAVSFENGDQLSWDDYGSADPANIDSQNGGTATDGTGGREKGLTIYGVAVNGQSLPDALSESVSWTDLEWQVGSPSTSVIDQKSGWLEKDLLTSNNVTGDNTYKFDNRSDGKLLVFNHAMTKVTVNLIADAGFPGYTTDHPENAKFTEEPAVTLLGFNYIGKVSVEGWTSTAATGTANFEAYRDNGTAWVTAGQHTTQFTALVFPGNQFANGTNILKLEVDGNTLYVNATNINAANTETNNTFEHGKNYIFNIIVKKTGITVTATIKNWDDVEAEEEAPKINVDYAYGHVPGTQLEDGFTLYRSTIITGSYIGTGDKADVTYSASKYTMSPQLYWPTHNTHYFFRGVWPIVGSVDGSSAQLGPTTAQVKDNTVDVENVAYKQGYYPSDLMIARPLIADETATDEACKVHNGTQGICATTGDIRMNFRYMMSQVKVELTSSAVGDDDHITFDANTKVEIIGGYKDGAIKLSDCSSDFTGKSVAPYTLHNKAADDYDSYHDAIIPQELTDGLKFRITTQNADGSTDTYEAVIKNIKVKEGAAEPALITAWESGKAYTYTLKITKTAINVTATITDWVPVTASDNIWF